MSSQIRAIEREISELKYLLTEKENQLKQLQKSESDKTSTKLKNEEIARYSRQIILPEIGVQGQLKLKNTSVLIVGAGGLGCPSALYLVGAGVGKLGIVDYDLVEINNLHRQLLHSEGAIGFAKVHSIKDSLQRINSEIEIVPHHIQLDSSNGLEIISQYDVILDATDNVATRYLLNDACILLNKPLVSGSAIQLEGQLTVYNYKSGPCYRCIFPIPPPPETVTNCGDGGVLGAITGVIGALQALEAIKIILNNDGVLSGKLLIFDGHESKFRNVKLRGRRDNCDICSAKPIITKLIDYEEFCSMPATDKNSHLSILTPEERITVQQYKEIVDEDQSHILIDVRSPNEFEICKLENSINISIKDIINDKATEKLKEQLKAKNMQVIVVCRRGNDSQKAVKHLQSALQGLANPKDIVGGLHAWSKYIDSNFPVY